MNTKAQPQVSPPAAPKRKRTWFGVLVIVSSALALLAVLLSLTLYFLFTSATPLALPETNVTQEDRDDLMRRWLDFQDRIKTDDVAAPFTLSSRDFNVFVDMMPRLQSRVHGAFEGDNIQEEFCLPLQIGRKTRYLKGTASVACSLKEGELAIDVVACRLNGHALPRWICRQLGRKSLNPEAFDILERFQVVPHLRSIELRDGCAVLTPRPSESAHE